jgi:hypothetical protein
LPAPNQPDKNNTRYFAAAVKEDKTSLHRIPIENSDIIAEIAANTSLVVLAQDSQSEWVNVIHFGSAGEPNAGWLLNSNLQDLKYQGRIMDVTELPLTDYQLNSRQELQDLLSNKVEIYNQRKKKKDDGQNNAGCGGTLVLGAPISWGVGWWAEKAFGTSAGIAAFVVILVIFYFFITYLIMNNGENEQFKLTNRHLIEDITILQKRVANHQIQTEPALKTIETSPSFQRVKTLVTRSAEPA